MKKYLLSSILLIAASFVTQSISAYDFSEENEDGVTIYYNVLNENDKTCEVTAPEIINGWSSAVVMTHYIGDVVIPSTANGYQVISIGDRSFLCCRKVTSVKIPSSVTYIDRHAFTCCSGLSSITIPNSVTTIGNSAFQDCTSLTSLSIGSSVKTIGELAFFNCNKLTSLEIPGSVTTIKKEAFGRCDGLTTVFIPKTVSTIGSNPFAFCPNLEKITVEDGNTRYSSMDNCNAVIETRSNTLVIGCKNTVFPDGITAIGDYAFSSCIGLTSFIIPNTVKSIGILAFHECSNLNSIIIPESVTTIGLQAFGYCTSLSSVTIPSSVKSIDSYIFTNCSNLTTITSLITDVFKTGSLAFNGCENATLYVPKGLVDIYKSTSDWNRITNIEEIPDIIQLALACNDKGKVLINGSNVFTNDMGNLDVYDGVNNTFVFLPGNDCKLKQVLVNGEDVTGTVKDNQLITTISEGSKMYVNFAQTDADVNGDGNVDISDVVELVNIILGQ